jgi:hypothetical protein
VIDQLRDFVDDAGHLVVQVGLIHHSNGIPRVHSMHAINHVAGVVWVKPVSSSADPRGGVCVGVRLLMQCIRDI